MSILDTILEIVGSGQPRAPRCSWARIATGVRRDWLSSLGEDIRNLCDGRQIVIVSSGAVALGRQRLALEPSTRLAIQQAAAASGQPLLMRAWEETLAPFGIPTGQLLLTLDDTESRRRWHNARANIPRGGRTLVERLMKEARVPVLGHLEGICHTYVHARPIGAWRLLSCATRRCCAFRSAARRRRFSLIDTRPLPFFQQSLLRWRAASSAATMRRVRSSQWRRPPKLIRVLNISPRCFQ